MHPLSRAWHCIVNIKIHYHFFMYMSPKLIFHEFSPECIPHHHYFIYSIIVQWNLDVCFHRNIMDLRILWMVRRDLCSSIRITKTCKVIIFWNSYLSKLKNFRSYEFANIDEFLRCNKKTDISKSINKDKNYLDCSIIFISILQYLFVNSIETV
jgi:hypothetical protein